jgi:hypothetical protein
MKTETLTERALRILMARSARFLRAGMFSRGYEYDEAIEYLKHRKNRQEVPADTHDNQSSFDPVI